MTILRASSMLLALAVGVLGAACGPPTVHLRPSNSCDSSPDGLKICRDQCDSNASTRSCYRLGWFYETGQEVSENMSTALQYYEKACNQDFAVACRALGQIYWEGEEVKRNARKAIEYYRKACTLGIPEACPTRAMVAQSEGRRPGPGDDLAVDIGVNAPNQPDTPNAPKVSGPQAPDVQTPSSPNLTVPTPGVP